MPTVILILRSIMGAFVVSACMELSLLSTTRLVLCVLLYSVVLCDGLLFGYVCEFVIVAFDSDE